MSSKKIIVPQGLINPNETTIIEIPAGVDSEATLIARLDRSYNNTTGSSELSNRQNLNMAGRPDENSSLGIYEPEFINDNALSPTTRVTHVTSTSYIDNPDMHFPGENSGHNRSYSPGGNEERRPDFSLSDQQDTSGASGYGHPGKIIRTTKTVVTRPASPPRRAASTPRSLPQQLDNSLDISAIPNEGRQQRRMITLPSPNRRQQCPGRSASPNRHMDSSLGIMHDSQMQDSFGGMNSSLGIMPGHQMHDSFGGIQHGGTGVRHPSPNRTDPSLGIMNESQMPAGFITPPNTHRPHTISTTIINETYAPPDDPNASLGILSDSQMPYSPVNESQIDDSYSGRPQAPTTSRSHSPRHPPLRTTPLSFSPEPHTTHHYDSFLPEAHSTQISYREDSSLFDPQYGSSPRKTNQYGVHAPFANYSSFEESYYDDTSPYDPTRTPNSIDDSSNLEVLGATFLRDTRSPVRRRPGRTIIRTVTQTEETPPQPSSPQPSTSRERERTRSPGDLTFTVQRQLSQMEQQERQQINNDLTQFHNARRRLMEDTSNLSSTPETPIPSPSPK